MSSHGCPICRIDYRVLDFVRHFSKESLNVTLGAKALLILSVNRSLYFPNDNIASEAIMFRLIAARVLDFFRQYFLPTGFLSGYGSAPTARSGGLYPGSIQTFCAEPNPALPGQPCRGLNQVAEQYEKVWYHTVLERVLNFRILTFVTSSVLR